LNAKSKLLYAYFKKNVKDVQEEKCLTKPKLLGLLGRGSIIGMDEAVLTESEVYLTTVSC
jgi:hypothetical protein